VLLVSLVFPFLSARVVLHLVYTVLLVSLDGPFLIALKPEKLATQGTQDEEHHGHSQKDNPEKLTTQGT
jgi:hypothetical protein